jgi:hypothetical protein
VLWVSSFYFRDWLELVLVSKKLTGIGTARLSRELLLWRRCGPFRDFPTGVRLCGYDL